MTDPREKAIEAACEKHYGGNWEALHPGTRTALRQMMAETIAAYEAAMWREPVAWRYKSEAPGGHSKWSVTQSRADLDTLSRMPFMRVEPLYTLPTVPEGE